MKFQVNDAQIVDCVELPGFEFKILYEFETHKYYLVITAIGEPDYYAANIDTGHFEFTRLQNVKVLEE